MRVVTLVRGVIPWVILMLIGGCESGDQRLVDYAQHVGQQQAQQSEAMARQAERVAQQSQELANTAHSLVEQDGVARRELIQAHERNYRMLQEEQFGLDLQRRELDRARQHAVYAAIREPVIAQAMIAVGMILATLLPLLVTVYSLYRLPDPSCDEIILSSEVWEEILARLPDRHSDEQASDQSSETHSPRLFGPGQTTPDNPSAGCQPE